MRIKFAVSLLEKFFGVDFKVLNLFSKLLVFDLDDCFIVVQVLVDLYFDGLVDVSRESARRSLSKDEFDWDFWKLFCEEVCEFLYKEILYYYLQVKCEYEGNEKKSGFDYLSGVSDMAYKFNSFEQGGFETCF